MGSVPGRMPVRFIFLANGPREVAEFAWNFIARDLTEVDKSARSARSFYNGANGSGMDT